jgi:peptidyl-prolyl cis-trans isomerase B (cyclophilin B)
MIRTTPSLILLSALLLLLGTPAPRAVAAAAEMEQAPDPIPVSEDVTPDEETATTPEETHPMVTLKTSKGDITLKLFEDKAPISVANFLAYVDSGHYAGTIFHRVIPNFMIQGGGFTPDMQQKSTREPIKNEAQNGLANKRGTIAMARTQIIDSATSQFFINVVDNQGLNYKSPDMQGFGYCVFGEVVEGMDVVDAIRAVPTGRKGPHGDVPLETVEILEAVRVTAIP